MAKPDAVFIYIGTYPSEAAAQGDYGVVKDLHAAGAVGTYDASVVTKDDGGKVHVNKDEMATRHGAWGGAAVARSSGSCSRPRHRLRRGGRGGGRGRRPFVAWHVPRRCQGTRGDHRRRQAALVIVGQSKLEQAVDKAGLKAEKHVARELDVKPEDIDKAVREAATEVT